MSANPSTSKPLLRAFAQLKWVRGGEIRFELVMPDGTRIPHTVRYSGGPITDIVKVQQTLHASSIARSRWSNICRLTAARLRQRERHRS